MTATSAYLNQPAKPRPIALPGDWVSRRTPLYLWACQISGQPIKRPRSEPVQRCEWDDEIGSWLYWIGGEGYCDDQFVTKEQEQDR